MIRRRILLGVLFAVLFALGWWAGRGRASIGLYSNLDLFVEVLHAVQSNYVDEVETGRLVGGAMQGMVRGLDTSSEYLDGKAWGDFRTSLAGAYDGVGLHLDSRDGWPSVIAAVQGSPAWRAGLLPGDVVTKVDGHSTWGFGPPELQQRLRGEPGTAVTLTLVRGDEEREREVTVTREPVEVPAVPAAWVMPGGVGYLRLAAFHERAAAEVRAALDTLQRGGARTLVVDLRGNPGGLVDQAVAVAGAFLPAGTLVTYTEGRRAEDAKRLLAPRGGARTAWPLALLVDGGTASAAEILAGALQDHDRALLVGSTTYGKGSVQNVFPLRGGEGAVKLTTARYFTPGGRGISRPLAAAAPDEADEDEFGDEPVPADTARADSAARPAFRTPAGRTVRGGGGITPDLAAAPAAGGAAPAAPSRESLAGDEAFQKAAAILRRAKAPADVFAALGPGAAPAEPPRAPRPAPHPVPGSR